MYSSNNSTFSSIFAAPPGPFSSTSSSDEPASGVPSSFSIQKPQPLLPYQLKPKVPWSSGLCHCFSDVRLCCLTMWCPCITFGRIAEVVDKGSASCCVSGALYVLLCCVIGCPCFYSCFYRSKMRRQYVLRDKPCCDCLVHCCCESCALCQEYRELRDRGLNMTIGWHGNMERQQRELMMAPVVEQGMTK